MKSHTLKRLGITAQQYATESYESVPDVAKLSSSMNGKLWPVMAAGNVRICPVVQQEIHTRKMALLRGNQQWCGQIGCLGAHVGT